MPRLGKGIAAVALAAGGGHCPSRTTYTDVAASGAVTEEPEAVGVGGASSFCTACDRAPCC